MLDKAIAIAIMLFILSMISERLVTWLKLHFGKKGNSLWLFSGDNEDLVTKSLDKNQEKVRETKILGLNIVIGILISLLSHADLFSIVNDETPYNSLGWDKVALETIGDFLQLVLGCILSGFFISLGSKFWHDMLDMLLYAKNLKQKLADPNTYEATSADQLTEYLSFSESDLVRLAIAQNEQVLKTKFKNIEFLNDSISILNGERRDVLGIYLTDNNTNGFPDKVPVKLPSGKPYFIQTEIIPSVGIARAIGGMDGSVSNSNLVGFAGSGCCIVSDSNQKNYLLTNCHVMTDGFLQNPLDNTGNPDVHYANSKIGTWQYGCMTTIGDYAMAEIEDVDSFITNNQPELFNNKTREILKDDWLKSVVTVRGNISGTNSNAFIIETIQNQLRIKYKEGSTLTVSKAILIGDKPDKINCRPVSDFGDSGGAVYDNNMNLIGIITAKSDSYTYAIPVSEFIKIHNLQIK